MSFLYATNLHGNVMDEIREFFKPVFHALLLGGVGVVVGVGNLLSTGKDHEIQVIVGRAIVSGGLGMASGAVLIWLPDVSLIGQLGLAAALASLGTSGIEKVARRYVELKRKD